MRPTLLLSLALALLLPSAAAAYPWPVKPFDRQHPIRGFFGDPRTVFAAGVDDNGIAGPGSFSFHQGVDVAAPDGTPVYAIADGRIRYMGAATVDIVVGPTLTFQYFHVVTVVGEGQRVFARKTVIGYVQAPYGHVHISEIRNGHAVNPLQRGHLTPYVDTTKPTVASILVENGNGAVEDPTAICGRIQIVADAYDTPPMRVPGKFNGLPVSPALVTWGITQNSHVVVPTKVAADFRHRLPPNRRFWDVYARGSYQNDTRFGDQQFSSTPGRYLFLLARRLDTRHLRNGAYTIHVRATDIRGNTRTAMRTFSVDNSDATCAASLASSRAPAPPVSLGQP